MRMHTNTSECLNLSEEIFIKLIWNKVWPIWVAHVHQREMAIPGKSLERGGSTINGQRC